MNARTIKAPTREADMPDIPDVDLASFTLRRAPQLGDKPALIDGASGRALSYAQLVRAVHGFAAGLAARGFGKGDTFCICVPNVPEFAVAFHGVVAAGGRCTTANPTYTARELGHQLADTNARMLLTVPHSLEVAREAAPPTGCELYVLGEGDGAISFSALLGEPAAAPDVAIDPARDIAGILYSGGTTGLPKGVLLSHRNLIATLVQAEGALGVTSEDVVIAALPFFHVYGLHVILNMALQAGATVVTLPRFELGRFLDLVERHRVTRGYIVPAMARALAADPAVEGRDLSALRHLLSAAAPLGPALTEACERRLGCRVSEGFGMTEMSGITHVVPPFGDRRKPGSIGPAIPGVQCRLVDPDTSQEVARGERGELWMRGPKVMRGYLNNPQATAAMIDPDGWLRSGDIAVVDDDGWFEIVGRIKEIIKYKGFQVFPAELEMILSAHPGVADCAVIGAADEEAGEVPKAFVVPAGDDLDHDSVMRFVAERVAPYKRIRAIQLVHQIPKSPSGRILRHMLSERAPVA
jgi:acyl-CoA synthetase (AMP-forming)/AMP-acid ligase II